ncbi:MAG TPA: glycosyltransferase family 1 protein, partial [Hanamia sp.]|nr:glycosyltransferase family 1 protein [Hanamia sp.]
MDFICFSHIRWNFVYQRPQHLLNRFAIYNRVFVIEEPMYDQDANCYKIKKDSRDHNLWVVVLQVSKNTPVEKRNHILKTLLNSLIDDKEIKNYLLWYYSPMALSYSNHLYPSLIIYDCMDELSAFKFAPPELKKMEASLMNRADLVFTGGHSLYEAKKHLHHNIHPFPSSIDKSHFVVART